MHRRPDVSSLLFVAEYVNVSVYVIHLCEFTSDLRLVRVSTGESPEFSARAIGTDSSAFANDLIPHWSIEAVSSAASDTAKAHATSGAPPP